ncbi:MAG TPA: hypothetical protein DDY78_28095 [Planctomycetales bacterium]|nr:hypothetical protein [Planctomycetales bacterium]
MTGTRGSWIIQTVAPFSTNEAIVSTISTDVTDWIAEYSDEPEAVREFCIRHGILDYVRITVEMAERCFAPVHRLTLSLWKDPCEGTVTASVDVDVHASVDETQARYKRFLETWSGTIPYPEWNLVSFGYYIV